MEQIYHAASHIDNNKVSLLLTSVEMKTDMVFLENTAGDITGQDWIKVNKLKTNCLISPLMVISSSFNLSPQCSSFTIHLPLSHSKYVSVVHCCFPSQPLSMLGQISSLVFLRRESHTGLE